MSATITDITAKSVTANPSASAARVEQLRRLKEASQLRQERMKRVIVLPDATADLRELMGDDSLEFTATIRRGSQTDVALLPDCPPAAREYVEVYLESLNKAMFEWMRGNPDVEVDKMTDAEKRAQNIEIGSKAQERVVSEFGGVENEMKRREVADAFCLALVVDPDIVPTEDDITDPDTQISLEFLSDADKLFIQAECQKLEEAAVETELKSVSAENETPALPEGVEGSPVALPETGTPAASSGDAADDAIDVDWVSPDES